MHRHQYKGRKLGRKTASRKALMRNLASQIILHEQITTTLAKAKEVRPILEKLITKAKKDTVTSRRLVAKFLSNNDKSLNKLFEQLGPLYKDRNGGYLRIIKTNNRKGDNAEMAIVQLLDTEKLTDKEVKSGAKESKAKTDKQAPTAAKQSDKTADKTKNEAIKKASIKKPAPRVAKKAEKK